MRAFYVIFLPLWLSLAQSEDILKTTKDWRLINGETKSGQLLGTVEGKAVFKDAQGKLITAPTNLLSKSDDRLIKDTMFQDLSDRIRGNIGKTNGDWPDLALVDPAHCEIQKLPNQGKWHIWASQHWKIHTERDLPEPIVKQLATLYETTLLSIKILAPSLTPTPNTRLNIHLFETYEGLRNETRSNPGRSGRLRSVLCVDEMLGLRKTPNGEFEFDPQFPARYLKMEIYELVVNESGAAKDLPMWLFYGFSRLVGRIPHQGDAIFPSAALDELRNQKFVTEAIDIIPSLPAITAEQWFASTPEMRKGKSEPKYRQELRRASFLICSYFRILDPYTKGKVDKIFQLAISNESSKEKLNYAALKGVPLTDTVRTLKRVLPDHLKSQWESLSARSIRRPRVWTNSANKTVTGEFRGVQAGGKLFIKPPRNKGFLIPIEQLSGVDQGYALANLWKSIDYERILTSLGNRQSISNTFWPASMAFPDRSITQARFNAEESEDGKYTYQSQNFHFTLFGRYPISENQMEEIGQLFEATRRLLSSSPFGIQASPVDGYFRAELFDTKTGYHLAGGPKLSSGVYLQSKRKFLVPGERGDTQLATGSIAKKSDTVMTMKYQKDTLVHEITHMMMHDILTRLPVFMIEGSAEYVENMPRENKAFNHANMMAGIRKEAHTYQLQQSSLMSKGVRLPTLFEFDKLLLLSRDDWDSYISGSQYKQMALYFSSFLLVAYFMENEPDRIIAMLDACRQDAPGLKVYNYELEEYNKAVEQFKKFPGVTLNKTGYTYAEHLPQPDLPIPHLEKTQISDTAHVGILLNGRGASKVANLAYDWLRANGLHLR